MAVINHEAELARAGANVTTTSGQIRFLARRYPLGAVGALIVLLFIFTALFANFIAPIDPTTTNAKASLARPGSDYCLGADFMGRDMFSRIVYGARISLAVGAGATLLGGVLGVAIGLMSGYLGGMVRSRHAAPHGHHAVAAAAGHGAGHGGLAGAVAPEHHHRHRYPAGAQRRARGAIEHPVLA